MTPTTRPLGWRDASLLVLVAGIWGLNFIPIRWALNDFPPFALAALRFLLAAVPMVFFVRRPSVPTSYLVAYGLCIGVAQFGLLFLAIHLGLAAGLASLLMQMQMFFTLGLAALFANDRLQRKHLVGAAIAGAGVTLLAADQVLRGASASVWGLLLVGLASLGWGSGNVLAKRARQRHEFDAFALTVWSSLVSPIPLAALSFLLDPHPIRQILEASAIGWGSLAVMAWVATLFGYSTWNRLLHRHPAGVVSPFTMLIPVFGMGGAYLVLQETLDGIELVAAAVIMAGIGYTLMAQRKPTPHIAPAGPAVVADGSGPSG